MSTNANTELLELAAEHIDYWTGTIWEKMLERDIATNDFDSLSAHLKESAAEMFRQEYNPNEVF